MSAMTQLRRNSEERKVNDKALGATDATKLHEEMNRLLGVLNHNALVAALFMTVEVPLLASPKHQVDANGQKQFLHWRMITQLIFASVSVVLHGLCIVIACETTFVLSHIASAFHDPVKRDQEYVRLSENFIGKRIEKWSGLSYLFGIASGMAALWPRLGSEDVFGYPAGDIAGGVIACIFVSASAFGYFKVGGYVGGVHRRAQLASVHDGMTTSLRDHRGTRKSAKRDHRGTRKFVKADPHTSKVEPGNTKVERNGEDVQDIEPYCVGA